MYKRQAENVATSRGISRARQDEWGVASQNRAEAAINSGFFAKDITPVTLPDGTVVSTDDGPRAGVTLEAVSCLLYTSCAHRAASSPSPSTPEA